MSQAPARRTIEAFRVVGLRTRTTNAEEMSGAGRIGELWRDFGARSLEVPWRAAPVAVYHDYESDQDGPYSLLVGYPMPKGAEAPAGWHVLEVPTAEYLVFRAEGEMPGAIVETWGRIWKHFQDPTDGIGRRYTHDLEIHDGHGADVCIAFKDEHPG